jgi:hypothetical protein
MSDALVGALSLKNPIKRSEIKVIVFVRQSHPPSSTPWQSA